MTADASRPRQRTAADREAARRLLVLLKAGRDVRAKARALRARLRRHDDYENDLKLTIAVERLMRELREG
jgi:hypothetical protein